jgi:elongation factor G
VGPVPPEFLEEARQQRDKMIESLSELDEDLMQKYLNEEALS